MSTSYCARVFFGVRIDVSSKTPLEVEELAYEDSNFIEYMNPTGCEIVQLRSSYSHEFAIVIKESVCAVSDWKEHILPIGSVDVGANWDDRLRKACFALNVDYPKPGWWVSIYAS